MKHPFDPRINAGHEQAVWHADKNLEAVVTQLIDWCRPDIFCETGTHMGWTSHYVASHWPHMRVETVECGAQYVQKARENLAEFSNVEVFHADSATWLAHQVDEYWRAKYLPLFWLDAHWWPPVPLRAECAAVATLPRYIAIIDDFECKNPDFPGDGGEETFGFKMCNLEYVAEFLGPRCLRPNYPCPPGGKGYGIFVKGVEFGHPLLKEDVL